MTQKDKLVLAVDHALYAAAITAKVARWEPFNSPGRGELCVGGLRWATRLDESGVPILTRNTRAELQEALAKAREEAADA